MFLLAEWSLLIPTIRTSPICLQSFRKLMCPGCSISNTPFVVTTRFPLRLKVFRNPGTLFMIFLSCSFWRIQTAAPIRSSARWSGRTLCGTLNLVFFIRIVPVHPAFFPAPMSEAMSPIMYEDLMSMPCSLAASFSIPGAGLRRELFFLYFFILAFSW